MIPRSKQALKVFKEVLDIQQATLGEDHDDIMITLDAIATSYGQQRRWKKAITYMDRVVQFHTTRKLSQSTMPLLSWRQQQKRLAEDMKLAMAYSRMGNLLYNNNIMGVGHVGRAIECWSQALHLYQSNNGSIPPNDWRVVQLQQVLVRVNNRKNIA